MPEPKHTPGPLEVGYYRPTKVFLGISEHVAVMKPDGSLVAVTGSTRSEEREVSEADARLFAAADEMFAAVTHLLRRIGEDPGGVGYHAGFATEVFERAVVAYAKATRRDEEDVRAEILNAQKANENRGEELRMLRRRIESLEEASNG